MEKNILVIPGDGIGQEVSGWRKSALGRIAELYQDTLHCAEALMGRVRIEATGTPLPDETLQKARKSDAILSGAVGHAKYDNGPSAKVRPEQGVLEIRNKL